MTFFKDSVACYAAIVLSPINSDAPDFQLTSIHSCMVFHTILALHKLQVSAAHLSVDQDGPYPSWHDGIGIACGPLGNSCSVEGHGGRGPGPMPLPGRVRAKFRSGSHSHDGDHSLFDLSQARFALSSGSGHSASQALPQSQRGYGNGAYQATSTPLYSTSHLGHVSREASNQSRSSFYGGFKSVPTNVDVGSAWGRSAHGAQFSSASAVSQTSGSSFHFHLHDSVVSMSSVAVVSNVSGLGVHSHSGRSSYSWRVATPHEHHLSATVMPSWDLSNTSTLLNVGFLAPEPCTQAPADGPAGYSSI